MRGYFNLESPQFSVEVSATTSAADRQEEGRGSVKDFTNATCAADCDTNNFLTQPQPGIFVSILNIVVLNLNK